MKTKQTILDYCLEYWNNNFCGISSHQVSADLDIDHDRVRRIFRSFKKEHKGTLTDDVPVSPLYRVDTEATKENSPISESESDDNRITITIFYPSKEVLTDYFYTSGLAQRDIPVYKKKMHLGYPRTHLFYFPTEVMDKYLENPDEYNIHNTSCGGFLSEKSDKSHTIRFGRRKITPDEQVIAVVLDDLSELSPSDQCHWHSYEMETPVFNIPDPDFHEYYLRYYEITQVSTYDPLNDLVATIEKINSLEHVGKLFNTIDYSRLQYPVKNTYENFYKCSKELFKIIAPSSINKKTLKKYLQKNFSGYEDLKHETSDENYLFKNFLKEINFTDNSIRKLTQMVKKTDSISPGDYLDRFRRLCRQLLLWHRILHRKLKWKNPSAFQKLIHPKRYKKEKDLSYQ